METGQQELVELTRTWEQIEEVLKEVPGADVKKLKKYFEEGPAKQGVHFFVVEYRPGTVIMAKGSTSDYAAIHLQGVVRVRHAELKQQARGPGCWHSPRLRRLENLVLNRADPEKPKKSAGLFDRLASVFFLRYPGVVLWLIDVARRRLPGLERPRRERRHSRNLSPVSCKTSWDRSIEVSDSWVDRHWPPRRPGPRKMAWILILRRNPQNLPMKSESRFATKPGIGCPLTADSWA